MKAIKMMTVIFAGIIFSSGLFAQYSIGDRVEDFRLKNTNGEKISLSDYPDAKGFIVVFTCNTCPFVLNYEQRIIELHKKFSVKGYPIVAINPNCTIKQPGDTMEEMKKRSVEKGYGFAYLRDDNQLVASRFGAERTPEIYLLEKEEDGLYLVYTGTIDNNVDDASKADKHYVSDAVNALLSGNEIAMKETRAIGCTIKWSE